jgi:hypothetical protein
MFRNNKTLNSKAQVSMDFIIVGVAVLFFSAAFTGLVINYISSHEKIAVISQLNLMNDKIQSTITSASVLKNQETFSSTITLNKINYVGQKYNPQLEILSSETPKKIKVFINVPNENFSSVKEFVMPSGLNVTLLNGVLLIEKSE